MIVFTAKVTRRKIVSGALALFMVACAGVAVVGTSNADREVSVTDSGIHELSGRKLSKNEDRVALLRECGWEVDEEPLEYIEVRIPSEFDGVYNEYNEIQKRQGMDLSKYSGKRVMRYTYKVNNHESKEQGVCVNLILYKDKLIGGDVSSPKLGGFMHGLLEGSGPVK